MIRLRGTGPLRRCHGRRSRRTGGAGSDAFKGQMMGNLNSSFSKANAGKDLAISKKLESIHGFEDILGSSDSLGWYI